MGVTVKELDDAFNRCQIGDWFVTDEDTFCWKLSSENAWWSRSIDKIPVFAFKGYNGWNYFNSTLRRCKAGLRINPLLLSKTIEDDLLWE